MTTIITDPAELAVISQDPDLAVCVFCSRLIERVTTGQSRYGFKNRKFCDNTCRANEKSRRSDERLRLTFFDDLVKLPNGCWESTRIYSGKSYSLYMFQRKLEYGHRLAWILSNGPVPQGSCVLHTCDNPPCCNPDHLFLGSQLDNIQDRHDKERDARGEGNGMSVLTKAQVMRIKKDHLNGSLDVTARANKLGVSYSAVYHVVKGYTWAWLKVA